MAYLLDTSILARLANTSDPCHLVAVHAVLELHRKLEVLHITPQNLIEFRNMATRPTTLNGLGLLPVDAEKKTSVFERTFPLLPETSQIYPTWKDIVTTLGIIGKQVHDARLVAVCHVHSITHILTFNVQHFNRMRDFGQGLVVVTPTDV